MIAVSKYFCSTLDLHVAVCCGSFMQQIELSTRWLGVDPYNGEELADNKGGYWSAGGTTSWL